MRAGYREYIVTAAHCLPKLPIAAAVLGLIGMGFALAGGLICRGAVP